MMICRCLSLLSIMLLMLFSETASAKKKTDEPTTLPSMEPSDSQYPSTSPTSAPSSLPSSGPTKAPTTSRPTSSAIPTMHPTNTPTTSPTAGPTKTHTAPPTRLATSSPTTVPSTMPTPPKETTLPTSSQTAIPSAPSTPFTPGAVVAVELPVIGIDLVVTDSDAASFDVNVFLSFIANILDINSGVGNFDYVSLEFDVIQSEFGRRRLDMSGLSIRIAGLAYYGQKAPTQQTLAETLYAYFSFWGVQDLEAYLMVNGLVSAQVASVSVGGEAVEQVGGSSVNLPGPNVEEPAVEETEAPITPAIIGGLVAGVVVLLLSIAFLVSQSQKASRSSSRSSNRRRRDSSGNSESATVRSRNVASGKSDTGRIGARPHPSSRLTALEPSSRIMSTDEESGSDGISVDNSLYTTDSSVSFSRTPSYDPARLDRVIAAAKQNS